MSDGNNSGPLAAALEPIKDQLATLGAEHFELYSTLRAVRHQPVLESKTFPDLAGTIIEAKAFAENWSDGEADGARALVKSFHNVVTIHGFYRQAVRPLKPVPSEPPKKVLEVAEKNDEHFSKPKIRRQIADNLASLADDLDEIAADAKARRSSLQALHEVMDGIRRRFQTLESSMDEKHQDADRLKIQEYKDTIHGLTEEEAARRKKAGQKGLAISPREGLLDRIKDTKKTLTEMGVLTGFGAAGDAAVVGGLFAVCVGLAPIGGLGLLIGGLFAVGSACATGFGAKAVHEAIDQLNGYQDDLADTQAKLEDLSAELAAAIFLHGQVQPLVASLEAAMVEVEAEKGSWANVSRTLRDLGADVLKPEADCRSLVHGLSALRDLRDIAQGLIDNTMLPAPSES